MNSWTQLVVFGVALHLILIYSIFDIYYTSPIVSGVPAHEITQGDAPAKRVVFISADGLRSDTFLQNPDLSPFLHNIIRNRKGVWGVSRSHVPTESRPGHVALFAGFSEDVSAVARGWKHNPVPFDSVVNRSKEAWLWGSPDIVSLFDHHPHVHSFSYSAEEEDFASDDASRLDTWVFDKLESFLNSSLSDPSLSESVHADRRLFFLHLLGIDTNGHGHKPHSPQYKGNIAVVDSGVERVQALFDAHFPDGKTAFVFTSDHGMTDWGSHGAGSDDEVLTPLVAWGAGVQKGGAKTTIAQVDVAPLVSSLLGVPVPVNSVGILPFSLIDATPAYLFRAVWANFQQLRAQMECVRGEKAHRLWFSDWSQFGDRAVSALEGELRKLGHARRYPAAASLFRQHAPSLRDALFHYHRYDRGVLGAGVSSIFVLWIAVVWVHLTSNPSLVLLSRSVLRPNRVFSLLLLATAAFCVYCRLPATNWLYLILPVFLSSVLENATSASSRLHAYALEVMLNYATMSFAHLPPIFAAAVAFCVFLLALVLVLLERQCLSLIFLVLLALPACYARSDPVWARRWRICMVLLLPFPFLPTVGRFEIPSLCVLSPILTACLLIHLRRRIPALLSHPVHRWLEGAHLATALVVFVCAYVLPKSSLPPLRLLCWLSLVLPFVAPPLAGPHTASRMLAFAAALAVPHALLSIAYESLFFLLLSVSLCVLFRMEFAHLSDVDLLQMRAVRPAASADGPRSVSRAEWRRSLVCVSLLLAALFGTGNFASLNSFSPATLDKFISVFSPFTMAFLLVWKLLLPLLLVCLCLSSVLRFDSSAIRRLSALVLFTSDLVAMCLFHQLRDSGSWLDIGLSISRFLVSMCMSVAALLLLLVSSRLATAHPHIVVQWVWEKTKQQENADNHSA